MDKHRNATDAQLQELEHPRRRYLLQFSLRLLLVATTAACIGLALWTNRARQQRSVVERLHEVGNTSIQFDYEFKNGRARIDAQTDRYKTSNVPAFLLELFGIDFFHSVTAVYSSDPKVIEELRRLPSLEALCLSSSSIEDSDLASIRDIRGLEILIVQADTKTPNSVPKITDRTLTMIGAMPQIKTAFLDGHGFTREGLCRLANARQLEFVHLSGCANDVTSQDLEIFKRLPRLTELQVFRGQGRDSKTVGGWSLSSSKR